METQPIYSKRTLLWDWTSTRDHDATPALQSTTASLTKPASRIASITNWNSWRPPELPSNLPFRPMIRTPAQLEGNEWDMIRGSIDAELQRDPNTPTPLVVVHTFNEPERIPLSVADALHLWHTQILPLRESHGRHRVKLVSPACASDPPGHPVAGRFHGRPPSGARQARHVGLAAAQAYFEERRARFDLPVIVSEVACTSRDPAAVDRFTRGLVRWLEEPGQGWVIEYGLFGVMREVADGFVSPAAQLLDREGEWTGLGKWWVGLEE
ncbi:hypothetical protein PG989_006480 [Apiospora arundinis]